MGNVLVVTVTKVETQSVLSQFALATGRKWKRVYLKAKPYYVLGQLGGVEVYMVQSEMGAIGPGAALSTVIRAIQDIEPIAVIMVGIAFGVDPNSQKLGDILVSRQIRSYEQQKVKGEKIIPRGDRVTSSPRLISLFRDGDVDWNGAKVHFGLILSGEKLIMSKAFREQLLLMEPEAVGGEMEGAGIYTAASEAKVDWILVKAICDWADESKNYDSQKTAATNAVNFLIHVLGNGGLADSSHASSLRADYQLNSKISDISLHNSVDPIKSSEKGALSNTAFHASSLANPFSPLLLSVINEEYSKNLKSILPITQLKYSKTYWGRSEDYTHLENYVIQKGLNSELVDIVVLPTLKSAAGNTSPSAWMEVYEEYCYLYSGWGHRLAIETISILRDGEKIRLQSSQPLKLFGFETIFFEGEPSIKQVYIHPVQKIKLTPTVEQIDFLQAHGLWVSAGYAWIKNGNRQLALKCFDNALKSKFEDDIEQRVLAAKESLKMFDIP